MRRNNDAMKRYLRTLVPIASTVLQDRYVVNATADEYYLPDDLVENAFGIQQQVHANGSYWMRSLDDSQIAALVRFGNAVEQNLDGVQTDVFGSEFVTQPSWQAIRAAGARCIAELGYDLSSLESDNTL